MTRDIDPKHQRRKEVIEEVLGPQARSVILTYLNHQKKITIGSDYCSPIEQIEKSLELFCDGAELIMCAIADRELNLER
jgi:hypothetical protein